MHYSGVSNNQPQQIYQHCILTWEDLLQSGLGVLGGWDVHELVQVTDHVCSHQGEPAEAAAVHTPDADWRAVQLVLRQFLGFRDQEVK